MRLATSIPLFGVVMAAPMLAAPVSKPKESDVISLADTLKPLHDRFNSARGVPRFVAILSPT